MVGVPIVNYSTSQPTYHHTHIRGEYLNTKSHTNEHTPPMMSDLASIITELESAVVGVESILSRDFVYGCEGDEYQESKYYHSLSEDKTHYYTYKEFLVRPVIEELLLNDPQKFIELMKNSKGQNAYLKSLHLIQLEDESINFSGMNLAYATFHASMLGTSNFDNASTNDTDFSEADLSKTNILQSQLDQDEARVRRRILADWRAGLG